MLTLGLDTSTPAVGVCLVEDGQLLSASSQIDARRHGELLAPAIRQCLEEAGRQPGQLSAVVVGLGPGPYTSLRVGIVTAATFGYALGIPSYGRCSLDALAVGIGGEVLAVTDARRREVYWARYRDGVRIAGPGVDRPAEVAAAGLPPAVVGTRLYAEILGGGSGPQYPDPALLIGLVDPRPGERPGPLVPLYLRRPDAVARA